MKTKKKKQMEHFFPQIQVKTKKKRSLSKIEPFFCPNSGEDHKKKRASTGGKHFFPQTHFSPTFFPKFTLRCTPIQIIRGDADVDLSQTIGVDTGPWHFWNIRCIFLLNIRENQEKKKKERASPTVVRIFVEHWGDNLQFYPNFALFSTLGG